MKINKFWVVGTSLLILLALLGVENTFAAGCVSGTLIKGSGAAVYYCDSDGKRLVFPNQNTYFTWYPSFLGIQTISDNTLASLMIGGNVNYKPGSRMLKIETSPTVYVVSHGGVLHPISSASVASCIYGTEWEKLINTLPDSLFTSYTLGTAVNTCSDYNKTEEAASSPTINQDKTTSPIDQGTQSQTEFKTITWSAQTSSQTPNIQVTGVSDTADKYKIYLDIINGGSAPLIQPLQYEITADNLYNDPNNTRPINDYGVILSIDASASNPIFPCKGAGQTVNSFFYPCTADHLISVIKRTVNIPVTDLTSKASSFFISNVESNVFPIMGSRVQVGMDYQASYPGDIIPDLKINSLTFTSNGIDTRFNTNFSNTGLADAGKFTIKFKILEYVLTPQPHDEIIVESNPVIINRLNAGATSSFESILPNEFLKPNRHLQAEIDLNNNINEQYEQQLNKIYTSIPTL